MCIMGFSALRHGDRYIYIYNIHILYVYEIYVQTSQMGDYIQVIQDAAVTAIRFQFPPMALCA